MPKFRKKPIVVEAEQIVDHLLPAGVQRWPDERGQQPRDDTVGYIDTLEGRMHVRAGDWVITGIEGEIYCCRPSIFAATYDPVEE